MFPSQGGSPWDADPTTIKCIRLCADKHAGVALTGLRVHPVWSLKGEPPLRQLRVHTRLSC